MLHLQDLNLLAPPSRITDTILYKSVSFILWTTAYFVLRLIKTHWSPEWANRVLTLIHGSSVALGGYYFCNGNIWEKECAHEQMHFSHYLFITWSWGYFAFDLLWCYLHGETTLMMIHHLSALACINIYMSRETSGCIYGCAVLLLEISNPLLQTRWFIKTMGLSKTRLFLIVEIAYLSVFVIARGGVGTYIVYKGYHSEELDYVTKVFGLLLYFVSLAFIYDIVCYLRHKYMHIIRR